MVHSGVVAASWRRGSGVALAALVWLAGCTTLPDTERVALVHAAGQVDSNQCSEAVPRLDRMIATYPDAPEIAEAHYIRGLCRYRAGQIEAAVQDFEAAIRKSQRPELTAHARASLGTINYQQGRWTRAADYYREAVRDLPDEPPTDQVLYHAAVAMQRAGAWRDASVQLGRILRKFPNSSVADAARQLAAWPHQYFAIQLGAFASAEAAAKTMEEYRARGIDAYQENIARGGTALWGVLLGRYGNYADAMAALPRAKEVQSGAFIIP